MKRLVASGKTTGGAVHDARAAALCLPHGVAELLTVDRDFSRFSDLKTRNPRSSKRRRAASRGHAPSILRTRPIAINGK